MEDYRQSLLDQLARYRLALRDVRPVLTGIGALGVAESQRAFEEQRLGETEWPQRYPNMGDPFLNVAGALADFIAGRDRPKPNRFERRPALIDEGARGGLLGSFTWDVPDDKTVEWGTNKAYAQKHHEGLADVQFYGEDARARMVEYLDQVFSRGPKPAPQNDSGNEVLRRNKVVSDREKQRSGKPEAYRAWLGRNSPSGSFEEAVDNDVKTWTQKRRAKAETENREYQAASRLIPLLEKNSLVTHVARRPLVGVTARLQQEILDTTAIYLQRKLNPPGQNGGEGKG